MSFSLGSGTEGMVGCRAAGCLCVGVAYCNLQHLYKTVVYCVTNLGFKEPQTSGCSS